MKDVLIFSGIIYLSLSIFAFIAGISHGWQRFYAVSGPCDNIIRLKTYFPTYKLGCYLMEPVYEHEGVK